MVHYFTDNWEKIQNFEARPDDILIATYPKAGWWKINPRPFLSGVIRPPRVTSFDLILVPFIHHNATVNSLTPSLPVFFQELHGPPTFLTFCTFRWDNQIVWHPPLFMREYLSWRSKYQTLWPVRFWLFWGLVPLIKTTLRGTSQNMCEWLG